MNSADWLTFLVATAASTAWWLYLFVSQDLGCGWLVS